MVKIPEEALTIISKNGNVVLVGSVDVNGIPNISPRYVLGVIGEERLLFADAFESKTFTNLKAWRKVTVAVMDKSTMGGFQLKGDAEEVTDNAVIAQAHAKLKENGFDIKPQRAWTLMTYEVFSMKPDARSKLPLVSAYE